MSWLTVDEVLKRCGQKKLSALSLEAGDRLLVGIGDATRTTWDLPFAGSGGVKVYAADTLVDAADYTIEQRLGTDTRDLITFDPAPVDGVRLDASATTGISVDAVMEAMGQAQDTVAMRVKAAGYALPEDTPGEVPKRLKTWNLDIGLYFLVSQLRRAPVAGAYPEVKERHDLAMKDLETVVAGKSDLSTWLEMLPVETGDAGTAEFGKFVGDVRVFRGTGRLA